MDETEDLSLLMLANDIVERWDDSNPRYVQTIKVKLREGVGGSKHSESWKTVARQLIGQLELLGRREPME